MRPQMRRVIAIGMMVLVVVSLVVSMLPPPAPVTQSTIVFLSPAQATDAGYRIIADVEITPVAEQYFVNDVLAYKFIIGDAATSSEFLYVDAQTGAYLQTIASTITLAPGRIVCESGTCLSRLP